MVIRRENHTRILGITGLNNIYDKHSKSFSLMKDTVTIYLMNCANYNHYDTRINQFCLAFLLGLLYFLIINLCNNLCVIYRLLPGRIPGNKQ